VLAGRAVAAEEAVVARTLSKKRNLPEAMRRRKVMTRVMEEMKKKPVSKNSRKQLKPCALTEVRPCTPLTANSNSAREKSMPWSQLRIPGSRSNGPARLSSLMKRITLIVLLR
jgi:hypothetical protein